MTSFGFYANVTTGLSGCVSGDESGRTVYDSGPIGALADISVNVFASVNGSASNYAFYVRYHGAGGWVEDQGLEILALSTAQTWSFTLPGGGPWDQFMLRAYARFGSCATATLSVTVSGTYDTDVTSLSCTPLTGGCAYGTQPQDPTVFLIYLTPALIDAASTAMGIPGAFAAAAFTAFYFTKINVSTVCAGPPPPWPAGVTLDTLATQNLEVLLQCLQYVLWPYLCECKPSPGGGAPAPTSYTCGTPPTPPGVQAQPLAVCDNADLCTVINDLVARVGSIATIQQSDHQQITLIQRQSVPFAYMLGAAHSGLSGTGDFQVQGILGLAVTFTTLPIPPTPAPSDPSTFHQLGKVTLGTAQGWLRSWEPTHSPYLILPIEGAMTRVGYTFAAGIVATITELVREP
jgi:hypothetical protein